MTIDTVNKTHLDMLPFVYEQGDPKINQSGDIFARESVSGTTLLIVDFNSSIFFIHNVILNFLCVKIYYGV